MFALFSVFFKIQESRKFVDNYCVLWYPGNNNIGVESMDSQVEAIHSYVSMTIISYYILYKNGVFFILKVHLFM